MKHLRQAVAIIAVTFTLGGVVEPLTTPIPAAQAKTTKVWIAPNHGHRYHYSKTCRGLNHAGKLKHVTKKWAKHHHYTLCGWEK
ncbi:MAG: hypothetical protein LKH74_01630 [Levilactobacillus sp.]|jgi:hypothetical protein|uniref:hypothetical protein n=1 Tax=Levilactobacillus sp. TaxID=2767919 RepID=UPI0025891A75|nr:hypothetical protein [Levilactobacillus sp.]MCH4123252.1 hypothetical protein [Levilactobacillus sp.]MCI1552610.1 hypothetical protein [Levilactobacillus sp.]MCI1599355.1 hypothetical protein [Levilactobacillus sp.]MCI1606542.1 hypothetical protein [Levilactobacillus sp.]